MENARLDKFPFFITQPFNQRLGIYPESPFQPQEGEWPPESDAPFIEYAKTKIVPKLESRFEVIEALADALETEECICSEEIEKIRRSFNACDA